jgi:hypothetical protein
MPPRLLSSVIIVFWLGMGIWLFVRELWPRLRPGEPPAYTFMASDEAARQGAPVRWKVFHNEMHAYDVETRITYQEKSDDSNLDDTFEMQAIIRATKPPDQKAPVRRLRNYVRVGRDGRLHAVHAQLHMLVFNYEWLIDVEGLVRDGQLWPRWRVKVYPADDRDSEERVFDRKPLLTTAPEHQFETPFPPLDFAERGIVLNPLHPPNRLDTLSPGQSWRMPLVGSLLVLEAAAHALEALASGIRPEQIPDLVSGLVGSALEKIPLLDSHVLPQPELLPSWIESTAPSADLPWCWVIEARSDEAVQSRIWVQQSDGIRKGLVLRQEVILQAERGHDLWIVQREQ